MEAIVFCIFLLYFLFLVWSIWIWHSYPETRGASEYPSVSILVAARNEEAHLPHLCQGLENLSYPEKSLEIIFVDDFSEDGTLEVVLNYQKKSRFTVQALKSEKVSPTPKKNALQLAVRHARGEVFLFTDADCRVGENWVSHMVSLFQNPKVGLTFGPIRYSDASFLEKMLSQEQAALLSSSLASICLHIPTMCNGANMAIRRTTFDAVNGFASTASSASGDDELLLHKVFKHNSQAIRFVKSTEAIVATEAAADWKSLYQQRRRWAGKWEKYLLRRTKTFAFFIFLLHVSWLMLTLLGVLHLFPWHQVAALWAAKAMSEGILIAGVMRFLGKKINLWAFLALQVVYSPYVVFFALISRKQSFTWKGRTLK